MLRLIFCFFFYSATFGLVEWPKPLLAATADEADQESAQPKRAAAQELA